MVESTVRVSMRDNNGLECSYAIINKSGVSIIIILKDSECAIFDYDALKDSESIYHYLLLKHYADDVSAYTDFLKLIGKMCKKEPNSKYFRHHKEEDNRMVNTDKIKEHMINEEEYAVYADRFNAFKEFVLKNRNAF